jgi:hypothetical protein
MALPAMRQLWQRQVQSDKPLLHAKTAAGVLLQQ